jgi:predicted transcriptional regulator
MSTAIRGSYLTPSFENALVSDVMRPGVITCTPETSLVTVAQMMASNHIHCVGVVDSEAGSWAMLSDLDLVAAGAEAEDRNAASACTSDAIIVRTDDSLERAAKLMKSHDAAHVIVVDEANRPVGVLSTLDIAGVIAWGRA